jgi:hypothetical protein
MDYKRKKGQRSYKCKGKDKGKKEAPPQISYNLMMTRKE